MHIPATDRIYFLDPLQDPFHTSKELLVFREANPRSWNSPLGKVTPVRGRYFDDSTLWWTTEDGQWVDGAALSPKEMSTYRPAMGLLSDDVFIIGTAIGRTNGDRMTIQTALRSDGLEIPNGEGGAVTTYTVDRWLLAAPWAQDCMPAAGDTQAEVDLKIQIAKQKFQHRLAETAIIREGQDRGWWEDLQDLGSHGYSELPEASFTLYVDAQVVLATGESKPVTDLPQQTQDYLKLVADNALSGSASASATTIAVTVPAQYLVRTAFTDPVEGAAGVSQYTIKDAARDRLNIPVSSVAVNNSFALLRSVS